MRTPSCWREAVHTSSVVVKDGTEDVDDLRDEVFGVLGVEVVCHTEEFESPLALATNEWR